MKFNRQTLIASFKLVFGAYLFVMSGGIIFVALGLSAPATIITIMGLLAVIGVPVSAVSAQVLAVIGLAAIISLPIVLLSGAWIEEGLAYFIGWKMNLRKPVKAGFEKLPMIGVPIGKTIG